VNGFSKIWRTVELGTHQSVKSLVAELRRRGFDIQDLVDEIPDQIPLAPRPVRVCLVRKSPRDLGFKDGEDPSREQILARGIGFGLALCSPEISLRLRGEYADQEEGGFLKAAMAPLKVSKGGKDHDVAFSIGNQEGRQYASLIGGHATWSGYDLDDDWIFVLPPWRTVRLGSCATAEEYIAMIERMGCQITNGARGILSKMYLSEVERDVQLFKASARDFGMTVSAPRRGIFARAAELGYYPCPAEVGPVGRVEWQGQPDGQEWFVASEPLDGWGFNLSHQYGNRMLAAYIGMPEFEWNPDVVWIWCRIPPNDQQL